ncbi:hypothetical protein C8F01DRAFT_1253556 [Mycena amicta]|nr:hypothetical protein C8F01DRAFT_1253556 [Mycena amicta]
MPGSSTCSPTESSVPTGNPTHSRDLTRELRLAIAALCGTTLLPEIIGLTNAFGFTDWELDSARRAVESDGGGGGVRESIKPILFRGQRLAAAEKKSRVFSHLD